MLGICGRATITTAQYLAAFQQRVNNQRRGVGNYLSQPRHTMALGFNAVIEQMCYSF
jgi:stalled ribosome alternative rescue factor ArfA